MQEKSGKSRFLDRIGHQFSRIRRSVSSGSRKSIKTLPRSRTGSMTTDVHSSPSSVAIATSFADKKSDDQLTSEFCTSEKVKRRNCSAVPRRKESIKHLVENLIHRPDHKISAIPENLLKHLYLFTTELILDSIMLGIWSLEGIQIFGHHLEFELINGEEPYKMPPLPSLDKKALSDLVDILLAKKGANISWLPDSIEKTLYLNILIIIFTMIELLSSSLELHIIGHILSISFGPDGKGFQRISQKLSEDHSIVSEDHINRIVDDLLANPKSNSAYIPD
eukprot:gene10746-22447_t